MNKDGAVSGTESC